MAAAAAKTPIKPLPPAAPRTPTKPLAPAAAAKTPIKPFASAARTPGKTPSKSPCFSRARFSHASENSHPNIPGSPPPPSKPAKSPEAAAAKSASAKKKPTTPAPPQPPRQRERRFIVAKKGARRRWNTGSVGGGSGGEFDFEQCREAAREALRASQEEFFRKERAESTATEEQLHPEEESEEEMAAEIDVKGGALETVQEDSEAELEGSSKVRALRKKAMATAMSSVPDPGSGRVKHLVQAFEGLLTISGATSDADRAGEDSWALPGLQPWKEEGKGDLGLPQASICSSTDFLNAGPNRRCSSLDGNSGSLYLVVGRVGTAGPQPEVAGAGEIVFSYVNVCFLSDRQSSESLRSSWNKKLKVTSQHPFKLRTEQRGRTKEQQFVQKVQEMLMEEEKKRCLLKPPVKERTEPVDLVLHSDVLERNKFAEQMRLERERQKELEEEERIRQLRKELVPKAQPMPYFDRPFVPKRYVSMSCFLY
ncbi:hypothetical protein PR202_ga26617 [Eleusine coracana subsp. coracana]|uniref:TPX2 C-terminal domain-containing protein n=1 Tax=Eleusine coracana subsp. coracana TaxID=191504 RepID=A0AAV5DCC0_ELECO|nr:hypothetical protein PR202_ga26617 [Eleusine coracana subsp. coracana]